MCSRSGGGWRRRTGGPGPARASRRWSGQLFTERLTYRIQPELSPRFDLRDGFMNYEFTPGLQLQVGQYPVSFQWRLSPRRHQFAEGGVASRAFSFPRIRDIGVLLHGENPRRSASYALGVYNGAGPNVELGASNGHMVSAGVHVAVHGTLPVDESDYPRARQSISAGVGLLAANHNEIRDWSLARSRAGNRRGDWVTVTADLQIQQQGFTLSAAGFGRSVTAEDARVGSYEGAGGEISGGYALVANRLELVGRYGQLRWDVDDPDTREAGWDLVLTLYHRGHAWKTRMQYSNRRRVADQGLGSDRSLIVETQLLF